MKRKPTKAELRKQLEDEMSSFEQEGGEVQHIQRGESANKGYPLKAQETIIFDGQKESRSYVNDVVAAIDARKKERTQKHKAKPKPKEPKKRLIYDDFGEPLRWVWDDE